MRWSYTESIKRKHYNIYTIDVPRLSNTCSLQKFAVVPFLHIL